MWLQRLECSAGPLAQVFEEMVRTKAGQRVDHDKENRRRNDKDERAAQQPQAQ
jgi:hypothetical protein